MASRGKVKQPHMIVINHNVFGIRPMPSLVTLLSINRFVKRSITEQ